MECEHWFMFKIKLSTNQLYYCEQPNYWVLYFEIDTERYYSHKILKTANFPDLNEPTKQHHDAAYQDFVDNYKTNAIEVEGVDY